MPLCLVFTNFYFIYGLRIHKKRWKRVLIMSTIMTTTITPRSGGLESLLITITTMRMNIIPITSRDKQCLVGCPLYTVVTLIPISGNPVINPLAAMVAPLAALALIAAASAVSVNPMLMSIATISRSRRHSGVSRVYSTGVHRQNRFSEQVQSRQERGLRQMRTLETFLSSLPANLGGPAVHEKLTLTFLECGELVSSANHCLERVACLYTVQGSDKPGGFSKQERDVVSM